MSYKQTLNFIDDRTRQNIHYIFQHHGVPNSIIEVGTFEGLTACYISDTYGQVVENLKIYCIDPHDVSDDLDFDMKEIQKNFLHNLSVCSNKNIQYIQKYSFDGLIELINRNIKVDFIYIDGDHRSPGVLEDLVLAWNLINVGGAILCDDVNWVNTKHGNISNSPSLNPRMGVENFIQCNWHRIKIVDLPSSHQASFIKTQE